MTVKRRRYLLSGCRPQNHDKYFFDNMTPSEVNTM